MDLRSYHPARQPPLVESYVDYQFIMISWIIAVASAVIAALIPPGGRLRLNPIDVIPGRNNVPNIIELKKIDKIYPGAGPCTGPIRD